MELKCVVLCVWCSVLLHVKGSRFEHDYDTEEYTLKSKGILRPIVQLSEQNGVKRVLCKNNVILVAMDNMTYAGDWNVGDIVVGGAEWACFVNRTESGTFDNHVELGFHRIIDTVDIKNEKRVDLYTRPAGLFDLFQEASIFYHHRNTDPISLEQTMRNNGRRSKRSVVPWKASSQDIPIDYEVEMRNALPGEGKVCYGDSQDCTVNTTLSFYEVRMLLDKIEWHKDFKQHIPINFNPDGDNSLGYFGFRNGQFVTNSTYFEDKTDGAEYRQEEHQNPTDASWEMFCEDCHMNYYPEVTFELEIDQLIGVKKYALMLTGPFETNINLKGSTSGEMSILLDQEFHKTPEHLWISIPLVEEISMVLTPKFNVTMDAHLDIKVTGSGEFQLGHDQIGNLTIVREWSQDGHVQDYMYETEGSTKQHTKHVEVAGELFYNMSMMTTVIDLKADICWKLPKNIFGFYLTSPMQIRVEPNVIGRSILDEDNVACAESEASVLSAIYLEDIKYDAELLGQKYDFLILPDKDNNSFYMQQPELILSDRDICKLQCFGNITSGDSIEEANTTARIVRGDEHFENLMQLRGDLMLFAPEGEGQSEWCGEASRTCLECTEGIVGKDVNDKCSTRLVSRNLAVKLDKLAHWVLEEWGHDNRKLYIIEAWNEDTSQHPDGKYGDESLYYEGRSAKIAITKQFRPGTDIQIDTSPETLQRLSQMAVCTGLKYVAYIQGVESYIEVGVEGDTPYTSGEQEEFLKFFNTAPPQTTEFCDQYPDFFPRLSPGESIPNDVLANEVLGGIDNVLLRNNDGAFMNKLFYYSFDNVDFQCEEVGNEWCGSEARECSDCQTDSIIDYAWTRCADRVMTPRLAAKLFPLSDMASIHLPGDRIIVIEAWDERTSEFPEGRHPNGSLHYEGRAVQLTLDNANPDKLSTLTSLALCAGFDAVNYPLEGGYIEATVKQQEGYFTVYSQFLNAQILKVQIPTFYNEEYGYPVQFASEVRKTDLYDGDGEHSNVYLSENFQVKEFMCPMRRYFRVSRKLVECLQWTSDFVRVPIEILYAYKTRSYNLENIEERNENERYRFQSGQAAEIRVTGYEDPDVLGELAMAVLKSCSAQFRLVQHSLWVGLHSDRVYMHVKVSTVEELDNWLHVWNVDGDRKVYDKIEAMRIKLLTGGPPIVPQLWETACGIPELGYDKHYLQVQVRPSCRDKSADFCPHSLQSRKELVTNLKEQMNVILGFSDGPLFVKNNDVDKCIAELCGSCNGGGSTWRKKLVACSKMLWSIKHLLYRELVPDQASFFNTDNSESTVHGVACKNGKVCLENTQVYSVFAPIILSTYRPDTEKAMEVRLYDSTNNPSPIIDLIEQEMAMRAEGEVHVYVEYERDLSALKKVVKILMTLNRDVSVIHFHVNNTVFLDQVFERIQDWIEVWRYDVCPLWGRAVMAPFIVDIIPEEQIAEGMKTSHDRNMLQREMRNRDLAWILKM